MTGEVRFERDAQDTRIGWLRRSAHWHVDEAERVAHFSYADSAAHREGVAAFLAQRAPRFKGEAA